MLEMRKPMSSDHRLRLKKNYVQLVNEMQIEYMIPYFIQEVSSESFVYMRRARHVSNKYHHNIYMTSHINIDNMWYV